MDSTSFVVRHNNTGLPAADLVVGVVEAQAALGVDAAGFNASLALSGNAATIASQSETGRSTATTAQIADKTHAINTSGKFKGRTVYNTSTDLIYFALGSTDVSKWRLTGAIDNTGDVTPS